MKEHPSFARLVALIDRLLGPGGCPWDRAQTHETLKRCLLEETYEVFDAIDGDSREQLCEELGDLILQPVMHAAMALRDGAFDIDAVCQGIVDKMERRHPHVFGNLSASTPEEVLKNWDSIKKSEKKEPASILAGVPATMPALLRAHEISKRAARSGFEWPDIEAVFEKLREEENELKAALKAGDASEIEGEIGDLLFTAVNIARWAKIEPEEALRKMLARFTKRFMRMEAMAEAPLAELSAERWDELWCAAKAEEAASASTSS
ncbi:MAG: nucleoside triphosphate pyrophosphohydrolase [Armatimonadetes bacterium]|nr:nucleoside triphosphate pyrophosphohydrolase [Armatimonadota bacterium]